MTTKPQLTLMSAEGMYTTVCSLFAHLHIGNDGSGEGITAPSYGNVMWYWVPQLLEARTRCFSHVVGLLEQPNGHGLIPAQDHYCWVLLACRFQWARCIMFGLERDIRCQVARSMVHDMQTFFGRMPQELQRRYEFQVMLGKIHRLHAWIEYDDGAFSTAMEAHGYAADIWRTLEAKEDIAYEQFLSRRAWLAHLFEYPRSGDLDDAYESMCKAANLQDPAQVFLTWEAGLYRALYNGALPLASEPFWELNDALIALRSVHPAWADLADCLKRRQQIPARGIAALWSRFWGFSVHPATLADEIQRWAQKQGLDGPWKLRPLAYLLAATIFFDIGRVKLGTRCLSRVVTGARSHMRDHVAYAVAQDMIERLGLNKHC